VIFQLVPEAPSMPSAPEPVDVTLPVEVIVRGLSVFAKTTGPVSAVLIVRLIGTAPSFSENANELAGQLSWLVQTNLMKLKCFLGTSLFMNAVSSVTSKLGLIESLIRTIVTSLTLFPE
jgi:hypothetical protein